MIIYISDNRFFLGFILSKTSQKAIVKIFVWLLPILFVSIGYLFIGLHTTLYNMLTLIILLFIGMKSIAIAIVYRYSGISKLSFTQWCCLH